VSTTDDDDTSAMVTDLAAANEEARGSTLSSVISGCRCSGDPTRRRAGDRMSAAVADPRDSRGGSAELHRSLANWTVADAMIHAPKVCGLATSLAQLHELFRDDHIHAALIVEHGALPGPARQPSPCGRLPHGPGYATGCRPRRNMGNHEGVRSAATRRNRSRPPAAGSVVPQTQRTRLLRRHRRPRPKRRVFVEFAASDRQGEETRK